MRTFTTLALLAAATLTLGAQQEPTFKATTQIVSVPATVLDSQGRLVPNLEQDQFTILDNGKPQEITFFQNETQPFTVVVMLDYSASMTSSLDLLRAAAEQFLLRMLPQDKGTGRRLQRQDRVQRHVYQRPRRSHLRAARPAVRQSDAAVGCRRFEYRHAEADRWPQGRARVHRWRRHLQQDGFGTVLDHAKQNEIMVYAIGLQSQYFNGQRVVRSQPDRSLRKIAEETGGGYFELKKTDELAPTFTRVAQELHSLYTLGFSPAMLDGKEHKLELRMKQQSMTARARKTYIASANRLSTTN
jgi:hypothetical protein